MGGKRLISTLGLSDLLVIETELISVIVSLVCLQINQALFRSYIWVHLGISLGYVLKFKAKNL